MNSWIKFCSLSKIRDLRYFLSRIQDLDKGDTLNIDMISDFFSSPEIIVSCAGIIDLLKESGRIIRINFNRNKLSTSGLENPFTVEKNSYELLSPMFKV